VGEITFCHFWPLPAKIILATLGKSTIGPSLENNPADAHAADCFRKLERLKFTTLFIIANIILGKRKRTRG